MSWLFPRTGKKIARSLSFQFLKHLEFRFVITIHIHILVYVYMSTYISIPTSLRVSINISKNTHTHTHIFNISNCISLLSLLCSLFLVSCSYLSSKMVSATVARNIAGIFGKQTIHTNMGLYCVWTFRRTFVY